MLLSQGRDFWANCNLCVRLRTSRRTRSKGLLSETSSRPSISTHGCTRAHSIARHEIARSSVKKAPKGFTSAHLRVACQKIKLNNLWIETEKAKSVRLYSNSWFRSRDLGVMGPARYLCAKLLWCTGAQDLLYKGAGCPRSPRQRGLLIGCNITEVSHALLHLYHVSNPVSTFSSHYAALRANR